ncbi:hypothetical protein ACH4E8_01195 [Streptomyces sp. NPDC017979]|uniref:hypothetical protein n=1 Tax=Streptomyces sp. NPDC017979 TaxID=3365024 RepID=UPI0037B2AAF3
MKKTVTALSRGMLVTALAAGGVLVAGNPVTAAETAAGTPIRACSTQQHKEFPTSGYNTDVYIKLCVAPRTNGWIASADGYWTDGGGKRKFDNFDIQIRLERNDKDVLVSLCDITAEVNRADSGTIQCQTKIHKTENMKGLSADGKVNYDLDADGKGGYTWALTGSPRL